MTANRICNVDDCCKPAKSRGWCNTHYEKWRRNGSPTGVAPRKTQTERFYGKYTVADSGCWEWHGAKDSCGYGRFGIGRATCQNAHRVSYTIHVGPIPEGFQVCHKCDNPSCVNPAHLFLGTHKDNMDDRGKKQRTARGERNGKSVITNEIAAYIRGSKLSERVIAKELGIHRGTVNAVRSGRTWKEVKS